MIKQTNIGQRTRSAAMVAIMATALAGPMYVSTSIATAPQAEAFGWSDIKKGAKKVGGAVKKGAKKVAKGAGTVSKKAGNAGLAVAGEAYKAVGLGGATLILKATGKYDEDAKRHLETARRGIDKYLTVEQIGKGIGKAGKKVGKVITGRNKIGESLPSPNKAKAEQALRDYMNGRARTSGKGIARKDIRRRYGSSVRPPEGAGDKKLHGIPLKGRPAIGNDKSSYGRPVYGKVHKGQGIRLKDIQKPRKHSRRHVIGRDKSVFGRPVFGKNRKTQLRRSNKKRFGNKMLRTNRMKNSRRKFDRRSTRTRQFNQRRNQSQRSKFQRRGNKKRFARRH